LTPLSEAKPTERIYEYDGGNDGFGGPPAMLAGIRAGVCCGQERLAVKRPSGAIRNTKTMSQSMTWWRFAVLRETIIMCAPSSGD
jgi:hypothetical protein